MKDIEPSKEKHYTTIRITKQLREALKTRGYKGSTYDTIIKVGMGITFEPPAEVTTSILAKVEVGKKLPLEEPLSSGLQGAEAGKKGRKDIKLRPRLSKQPELLAQIAKLKNEGWSGEKIGNHIGYPRTTVDKAIEKLRGSGAIK
jgi:hypothetical protein